MEKVAKTYNDPEMQKLVDQKKELNIDTSAFISNLINFKRMINGYDSKWFSEKSSITRPIPVIATNVLSQLMADFQEIAQESHAVIEAQYNFFLNRNKRKALRLQKKQQVSPTTEAPDLSKEIKASNKASGYYLISEASNPLSRFFYRLLNPAIGGSENARIRKYRVSLLNSALQVFKDLKELQKVVVGSGPDSIFAASKILDKIEDHFVFLSSGIQAFKETLPQGVEDVGGKIVIPHSAKQEAQKQEIPQDILNNPQIAQSLAAIQDVNKNGDNFSHIPGMMKLIDIVKEFSLAPIEEKLTKADDLLSTYEKVIENICSIKKIPPQKTLRDALIASSAQEKLQSVAQNILGKWKHEISPFDKTSAFRLDIYNLCKVTRTLTDKIMDELQEAFDLDKIVTMITELGNSILTIRTRMRTLTSILAGSKSKNFIPLLEQGKLSDYEINLSQKEKDHLQRSLENKQINELMRMYSRK